MADHDPTLEDADFQPPEPGSRGPTRRFLDARQRAEFIKTMGDGYGRQGACRKLGYTFRQLRNTLESSPQFARDCRDAAESARHDVEHLAHQLAMTNSGNMTETVIKLNNQRRQLDQARRDRLAAERAKDDGPDKGELVKVITRVAGLFLLHVPPEKLPALTTQLHQLIGEVAGVNPDGGSDGRNPTAAHPTPG